MVTTTIRGREGYEWLELAGRRFPPSEEESPHADMARSLGPLTPEQCANLLCIPVPNRQTPDGVTIGAILDVLSRASAGERVRFTHGGRERTMASARTLQRWAEDLGVDGSLITVDVPGEVDVVDITVGFVGPSACIMPPGWLDASSGAWLDVAAEQFYNIKRDPGETCDALRTRLRAEQRKRDAAAVEEDRDRGTEPWLRRRLGALLGVEPSAFGIESVEVGVVLVTAWQCGVTVPALNAALAKLEEELPLGVRLEAAPVRVTNPVPMVTPGPAVHRSDEPQGIPIATPAEHIDLLDAMARRPSPPADDAERARRFFAGEGERTTRVNQWQGARHFWERGAR